MPGQRALQLQELFEQAIAFHQKEQLTSAAALYEQVLALQPRHFESLRLLGALESQTGNHERALQLLNKALRLNPAHPAVHNCRGIVLQDLKQLEQALACYNRAIAIKPDYAEAHNNRGTLLKELGQLDEAVRSYDRAVALSPSFAEAHENRGNALKELARFDAALESYDRGIALNPKLAGACYSRGFVLQQLRRPEAALQSYDAAIALRPDYAEAYCNRGVVLKDLKQFDAAFASYDEAIACRPDFAEAHWNKSLTLLLCGHYEEGWQLYEWRWKRPGFAFAQRQFPQPLWLGTQPLAGKTILLYAEQGLGDTIQFCRYARRVSELGARVVLEVHKSLRDVLASVQGVSEIVAIGQPLPAFDYHCPLLSLPLAFKTTLTTVPAVQRYVNADAARVAKWQERLGVKTKPRIGIAWSGAIVPDPGRSIPLAQLVPLLASDAEFISLQKEVHDDEKSILEAHAAIRHFGNELDDFADTAAVSELMDVVVSSDTSVAHLAGALGKEAWILLPFIPDWRWLLDRDNSVWYPSARLFRQRKRGDWGDVIGQVRAELAARFDGNTGAS